MYLQLKWNTTRDRPVELGTTSQWRCEILQVWASIRFLWMPNQILPNRIPVNLSHIIYVLNSTGVIYSNRNSDPNHRIHYQTRVLPNCATRHDDPRNELESRDSKKKKKKNLRVATATSRGACASKTWIRWNWSERSRVRCSVRCELALTDYSFLAYRCKIYKDRYE